MPSRHATAESSGGAAAGSVRRARHLWLGWGKTTLLLNLSEAWMPAIVEFRFAFFQGLLRFSRGIDARPIERSNIIPFLKLGNSGRGVRGITLALADPSHSGRKIGHKK